MTREPSGTSLLSGQNPDNLCERDRDAGHRAVRRFSRFTAMSPFKVRKTKKGGRDLTIPKGSLAPKTPPPKHRRVAGKGKKTGGARARVVHRGERGAVGRTLMRVTSR